MKGMAELDSYLNEEEEVTEVGTKEVTLETLQVALAELSEKFAELIASIAGFTEGKEDNAEGGTEGSTEVEVEVEDEGGEV